MTKSVTCQLEWAVSLDQVIFHLYPSAFFMLLLFCTWLVHQKGLGMNVLQIHMNTQHHLRLRQHVTFVVPVLFLSWFLFIVLVTSQFCIIFGIWLWRSIHCVWQIKGAERNKNVHKLFWIPSKPVCNACDADDDFHAENQQAPMSCYHWPMIPAAFPFFLPRLHFASLFLQLLKPLWNERNSYFAAAVLFLSEQTTAWVILLVCGSWLKGHQSAGGADYF